MEFFEPELFRVFDRSTQSPETRSDDRPRDDAFERLLDEAAAADARNEAAADKRREDARYDAKRAARESSTNTFESRLEPADADREAPQASDAPAVADDAQRDRPDALNDRSDGPHEADASSTNDREPNLDAAGATESADDGGDAGVQDAAASAQEGAAPVSEAETFEAGDTDPALATVQAAAPAAELAAALRDLRNVLAAIAPGDEGVSLQDAIDAAAAGGAAIDSETLLLVDALLAGDLTEDALIAQSPETARVVIDALTAIQAALSTGVAPEQPLTEASRPELTGQADTSVVRDAGDEAASTPTPATLNVADQVDADAGSGAETGAALSAAPAVVVNASAAPVATNVVAATAAQSVAVQPNASTLAPSAGLAASVAPAERPSGDAGAFASSDGDGKDGDAGSDRDALSKRAAQTSGARPAQQAFSETITASARPSPGATLTPNATAALEAAARAAAAPPPPPVSLGVEAGMQGTSATSSGGAAAAAPSATGVNTPSAPSAPAQTFAASTPPAVQLAAQIADAVRINQNNIQIRMSPAELGNVRVSVQVSGKAMLATVVVERAETLDLLQQDARTLVRVLTQLGFELDDRDIAFMLEDEAAQGGFDRSLDEDSAQGDPDLRDDASERGDLAERYGVERLTPMDGVVDMRV